MLVAEFVSTPIFPFADRASVPLAVLVETRMDLAVEFSKRAPWITRFAINGVESGGSYDPNDIRIPQFLGHFPNVRTILELGSLEGGQTFLLARCPGVEQVLAIEGRASNIEKANFVRSLLGITNVEFRQANLEQVNLTTFGQFDAVFCCGILYHLPEPWKLIQQAPQVAPRLFLWTVYAEDEEASLEVDGLRGREHNEGGPDEPRSGLSPKSIWLTFDSLLELVRRSRYRTINVIEKAKGPYGSTVTLGASLN